MLSIGEFSKVTSLTIKTLRLYDEKGLVKPAHVSEETGYRYYDARSVDRARIVAQLRAFDFSLADIAEILAAGEDEGDIVSFLEQHQAQIARRLERYEQIHRALETIVSKEREAAVIASQQSTQIVEKDLEPVLVAGIRGKGQYAESGKRFAALGRAVGRYIAGKPLGLYYDQEYKEQDADFESCFPIRKAVEEKEGILVHRLEGGRCVSAIHVGPYAEVGPTYRRLFEYLRQRGLEPRSPTREVYVKGPGMIFRGNPKKYVTEIQVLVEG